MSENDLYAISGRIKNHIAKEDIAISPVGTILVNYFSHALKLLYDFSSMMEDENERMNLKTLLQVIEQAPRNIIMASTPKEKPDTTYERIMKLREQAQFQTNEEALAHFQARYDELGGDEAWFEAEEADKWEPRHKEIHSLARSIQMCKHLIKREQEDG